jgi:hypothetical protein
MYWLRLLLLFLSILFLAGCVDITGRSATRLASIQKRSGFVREGHVYCIRGWLGIWSRGLDVIAQRADSELGVQATSLGAPEWKRLASFLRTEQEAGRWSGPLILVGHSIGSDEEIRVAKLLNAEDVPVDLLILLDPDEPPTIPPNVRHCVDIFKSHPGMDYVPVFRGVKVRAADPTRTLIENIDLRTSKVEFDSRVINHFNIAESKRVQDMVLAEIAKACPRKKR